MPKRTKYFIAGAFIAGLGALYAINEWNKHGNIETQEYRPEIRREVIPESQSSTVDFAKSRGYQLPPQFVESVEVIGHHYAGTGQILRDKKGDLHKFVLDIPPNPNSLEKALEDVDTNRNKSIERHELTDWFIRNIKYVSNTTENGKAL